MSNVYVNNFNILIFDFYLCFKSNNPINSSNFEYKEEYMPTQSKRHVAKMAGY